MTWEYLTDRTIGQVRVRLATTDDGFVVTKISPGDAGQSLRITRKRFSRDERHATGSHCMAEALSAGESESERLRSEAQQAIRKAFTAQQTMRPGCAAIRDLEGDGVTKTRLYLETGLALSRACAELEQDLNQAGFPTGKREMPEWIVKIYKHQHVEEEHITTQ